MSFSPYLFFVGSCREAMTAYQDVLGGQLDLVTAADMPDAPPDVPKDVIMHAALTLPNGGLLMASDDLALEPNTFAWDPAADPMPLAQEAMHPAVQGELRRQLAELELLEREGTTAGVLRTLSQS